VVIPLLFPVAETTMLGRIGGRKVAYPVCPLHVDPPLDLRQPKRTIDCCLKPNP